MIIDNPSPAHIPALRRLWQQAFGDTDAFLDSFFAVGFSCNRCRCVFFEGEPVAAVYLFDCLWQERKIAYLYALAVEKSHQKQGLSRLLLADTHALLQQMGYQGAVMEPATGALTQYYCRLGYRVFGSRQETTCQAAVCPAEIRELGELGYEQARRLYLPEGAVLQEGAFSAMLHTQAAFYGGKGFTAAVSREENRVLEFLGDPQKIPGLLRALHMEKARVRLPGGQPGSVYLDFFGGIESPAYFGLPLD